MRISDGLFFSSNIAFVNIIKPYGSLDYYQLFVSKLSPRRMVGWRGRVCCDGFYKRATTHMKNSGDDGLSLVEPASRNPLVAPDPVSFSHLSL